jgi:hypothetical protein
MPSVGFLGDPRIEPRGHFPRVWTPEGMAEVKRKGHALWCLVGACIRQIPTTSLWNRTRRGRTAWLPVWGDLQSATKTP